MIFPLSETPDRVSFADKLNIFQLITGIGLILLLFTAVWDAAGFSQNIQTGLLARSKGWNYRVYAAADIFLHQKTSAMLILLFGAGLFVFVREKFSKDKIDLLIRRQIWLILLGVVNALIFFFSGDLLFLLGIMGILFFPFARMQPRFLFLLAALFTLVFIGKVYWDYADDQAAYKKYIAITEVEKKWPKDTKQKAKKDTLTKEQQEHKSAWEGIAKGMKYDSSGSRDKETIKSIQNVSYPKNYRTFLWPGQYKQTIYIYTKGFWSAGSLILLGMALYASGFFAGEWGRSRYWIMAIAAFGLGLLLAWWRIHHHQLAIQDYGKYNAAHALPYRMLFPLELLLMAFGYLSAIIALFINTSTAKIWQILSIPGKIPLSFYLIQCLGCSIFFVGSGMGNYGRLNQWQSYLFAAEFSLVLMVGSILWCRRFRTGPLEWLLDYAVTGQRPAGLQSAVSSAEISKTGQQSYTETESIHPQTDVV